MRKISLQKSHLLAVIIAGAIGCGPALAEKPSWSGGEKAERHESKERHKSDKRHDNKREEGRTYRESSGGVSVSMHFGDSHRAAVRNYYAEEFRGGHCPPGLAKKRNGCMPPGQAKKWSRGHPLPRDVVYYDLPPSVLMQLGPAPAGHRYVRVASDILLIAVGTMLVADAIEDLGR